MRWRGYISRMYIHRPILMWYAMRKTSFARLPADKQRAITTCRQVANELIQDIAATWKSPSPGQMAGWCATWQLYQATMVPLLSLFCDVGDPAILQQSEHHVQIALKTLEELERWSPTALRSHEVVAKIYDAGCSFRQSQPVDVSVAPFERASAPLDTPSTADSSTMYDGLSMQDFFGEISWDGEQMNSMANGDLDLSFLDYWEFGDS
jgi:hypothetical protein